MRPWMSACLPLPPIKVVLSLSTTMRLMWPRSSSPVFSSLKPSSSAITLPPVTVATSELHPRYRLGRGREPLRLLHRGHAVLARLLHRGGDDLADLRSVVRWDRPDLGHLLRALAGHGDALQLLHHQLARPVDAALQ